MTPTPISVEIDGKFGASTKPILRVVFDAVFPEDPTRAWENPIQYEVSHLLNAQEPGLSRSWSITSAKNMTLYRNLDSTFPMGTLEENLRDAMTYAARLDTKLAAVSQARDRARALAAESGTEARFAEPGGVSFARRNIRWGVRYDDLAGLTADEIRAEIDRRERESGDREAKQMAERVERDAADRRWAARKAKETKQKNVALEYLRSQVARWRAERNLPPEAEHGDH